MRICKVMAGDSSWDVRAEKMVNSLVAGGHEVFIACSSSDGARARTAFEQKSLRPMPALPWLPVSVNQRLAYPSFISPRWLKWIAQTVEQDQCDAIFVRDLPLALAGIMVGRRLHKPVVLDLPDDYPARLEPTESGLGPAHKDPVLRSAVLARNVEDLAVRRAQRVIMASHESFSRLVTRGLNPYDGTIIRNTPLLGDVRKHTGREAVRAGGPFTMLYVGPLVAFAGLDTALHAMPVILRRNPGARLYIRGTGPAVDELVSLAARIGIRGSVDFDCGEPRADDAALIRRSDVCLLPHHRSTYTDTWLPPALFDCMAHGRPVLVSAASALCRIVERDRCGTVFEPGDSGSLANAIADLSDESYRDALGAAGRRAVYERYHWECESVALLETFESVRHSPLPSAHEIRDLVLASRQRCPDCASRIPPARTSARRARRSWPHHEHDRRSPVHQPAS